MTVQMQKAIQYLKEQKREYGTPSIFSDYCDLAIECIEKQSKTEWIPCEERLPSEDEYVLCQGVHSQFIACIDSLDGKWRDNHYITRSKVIAWQPLPLPYKKEGAE